MGPWSADLPDVSPPEKQLACQHARLFKYTLRHAPFVHAGMQSLMQKLWFEVMVRYEGVEDFTKRRVFWMSCPYSCCLWAAGLVY